MTGTIAINNGQTTVTFTYTKPSVTLNPVLLNAAELMNTFVPDEFGT